MGIVAVVLVMAVKRDNPAFAVMVSLAASVLIMFMVIPSLSGVLELLTSITGSLSSGGEYIAVVVKIIGVAYISEFGASVCADAGETGLASKIELAGKVLIMAISAPVVATLLNAVVNLI